MPWTHTHGVEAHQRDQQGARGDEHHRCEHPRSGGDERGGCELLLGGQRRSGARCGVGRGSVSQDETRRCGRSGCRPGGMRHGERRLLRGARGSRRMVGRRGTGEDVAPRRFRVGAAAGACRRLDSRHVRDGGGRGRRRSIRGRRGRWPVDMLRRRGRDRRGGRDRRRRMRGRGQSGGRQSGRRGNRALRSRQRPNRTTAAPAGGQVHLHGRERSGSGMSRGG